MTLLVAMVVAGAASYVLRVLPFLLVDRVRPGERAREALTLASAAALAAVLAHSLTVVSSLSSEAHAARPWIGMAAGLAVALRGGSLGRVALVGFAAYLLSGVVLG